MGDLPLCRSACGAVLVFGDDYSNPYGLLYERRKFAKGREAAGIKEQIINDNNREKVTCWLETAGHFFIEDDLYADTSY